MAEQSGRRISPRGLAEEGGVDAYALVEFLGRQGEVRRLRTEWRTVVDWLTEQYADLDDRLTALGVCDEARRVVWASFTELIAFHDEHYRYSIGNTDHICNEIEHVIRSVNQDGTWWQQRAAGQLVMEGIA